MTAEQKAYMSMFADNLLRPILSELVASMKGDNPIGVCFPGFEAPEQGIPAGFAHTTSVGLAAQLPSGDSIVFTLGIVISRKTPEQLAEYLEKVQSGGAIITFDKGIVQG